NGTPRADLLDSDLNDVGGDAGCCEGDVIDLVISGKRPRDQHVDLIEADQSRYRSRSDEGGCRPSDRCAHGILRCGAKSSAEPTEKALVPFRPEVNHDRFEAAGRRVKCGDGFECLNTPPATQNYSSRHTLTTCIGGKQSGRYRGYSNRALCNRSPAPFYRN